MSVRKFSDWPETPLQMAMRAQELSRKRRATLTCDIDIDELHTSLGALSNISEPRFLFDLLRKHGVRFRGAAIEFIFRDRPESPIGVTLNVPLVFMCKAAWFMDRDPSSHILLEVESGVAARDTDLVIDRDVLRRAEVTKTLYPEYGFAWAAALAVSKTPDGAVALYLYGGSANGETPADEPLTDAELVCLENMCRPIAVAVERMKLPRGCRSESLRRHITERNGPPERAAYIIQDQDGTVIEGSSLALQVVNAYCPPTSWRPDANPFSSLIPLHSIAADASHDWHQQRHSNSVGELLASGRSVRYAAGPAAYDAMSEVLIVLSHQIDPAIRCLVLQHPAAEGPMPVDIFIASASEDAHHVKDLTLHMTTPLRRGQISYWHQGLLQPGDDRVFQSDWYLRQAQILIVLLSANFIASHDFEDLLRTALTLRTRRGLRIVPILLRPCIIDGSPIADLELLPTNRVEVVKWQNKDEAWVHVVSEILKLKAFLGHSIVTGAV